MFSNQFRRIQIFKIYNLTDISHSRNTKYKLGVAFHPLLLEFKCCLSCKEVIETEIIGDKKIMYMKDILEKFVTIAKVIKNVDAFIN